MPCTVRLLVSVPEGNAIETGEPATSVSVPSELMVYSPTAAAPSANPATSRYWPDGSIVIANGATSCTRTLELISVVTPVPLLILEPNTPVPATPAYRNALFGVTASPLIAAVANWLGEPERVASAPVEDTE